MKNSKIITLFSVLIMLMLFISSCNDSLDDKTFFTTDEMNIIETLEANPEKFSLYLELLKKTEYYSTFKSYGAYTCFAPTDVAMQKYLQEEWNASSLDELNTQDQFDFFQTLVKFHTLPTTRRTSAFIEGRVADTTYTGDYLTTSYLLGGGISNIQINREAKLDQYDIETANGVIHAIDQVLSPFIDPIPVVMEKSGNYTIFIEALKQTDYFDTFSVIFNDFGLKTNFTILAESDDIYRQEGINSFEELANFISPDDTNYLDGNNDLNRFIAYHVTQNFLYSADFPENAFISTVLPKNAIKSFKTDKELRLNETETGVDDTWTSLIAEHSNFPAKNGVYHTVDKLLTIFTPKPKHILFDPVNEQPEVQSRLVRRLQNVPSTTYEFVRWFPESNKRWNSRSNRGFLNNTIFDVGGYSYFEFDTSVVPKGKYELLVCSNGGNRARGIFQIYWDGEPVGGVYDLTLGSGGKGFPDEVLMESRGWRLGLSEDLAGNPMDAYTRHNMSRFIVTKELLCPEQKRHVFRMQTVKSGGSPIDYIELIPVE